MKNLFILTILFAFYCWQGVCQPRPEIISDQEIENMKIKDLRTFLKDRGVECHGCAEKTDFVTSAKKVKYLPKTENIAHQEQLLKQKQKQQEEKEKDDDLGNMDERLQKILRDAKMDDDKEPKVSFGTFWEEKAISLCQKIKTQKTGDVLSCSEYGAIASGILKDMLKNMGSVLGKTESQVLKISQKQPYLSAGERTLRKGYEAAINPSATGKDVKQIVSKEISSWFLHTVMENQQSLYQGMDLDELMKTMKNEEAGKNGAPPVPPAHERRPRPPPAGGGRNRDEL